MSGMNLNQLINMLSAARDQGATKASVILRNENGIHDCAEIDWVSPEPIQDVVYILPLAQREVLGNEAAESVDL